MSQVYLRDTDGSYWPIPYSDRRLPAVTLSEINAVRRQLLDAGHRRLTQNEVFAALDQQRELAERAAGKSKAARRDVERARRALVESAAFPEGGMEPVTVTPTTAVRRWSVISCGP